MKGGRFTGTPNSMVSFSIPWRPSPWRSLLMALYRRWQLWVALGKPELRFDTLNQRLKLLFFNGFLQVKTFRDPYPGIMHGMIFFGFVVLFIGTALIAKESLHYRAPPGMGLPARDVLPGLLLSDGPLRPGRPDRRLDGPLPPLRPAARRPRLSGKAGQHGR